MARKNPKKQRGQVVVPYPKSEHEYVDLQGLDPDTANMIQNERIRRKKFKAITRGFRMQDL